MSNLNYTTGNPNNLVGAGNASMNDIQGPFVDVRSFLNGGNLDEANVPNLSAAFTTYKLISMRMTGLLSAAAPSGNYALGHETLTNTGFVGVMNAYHLINLNSTLFLANARATKYRLVTGLITNNTAPGITFTPSLQQVTAVGGAGAPVVTAASLVTGSNAGVITTPPLGSLSTGDSGDFTAGSGLFAIVVVTSGTLATNAQVTLSAELYMRQV